MVTAWMTVFLTTSLGDDDIDYIDYSKLNPTYPPTALEVVNACENASVKRVLGMTERHIVDYLTGKQGLGEGFDAHKSKSFLRMWQVWQHVDHWQFKRGSSVQQVELIKQAIRMTEQALMRGNAPEPRVEIEDKSMEGEAVKMDFSKLREVLH